MDEKKRRKKRREMSLWGVATSSIEKREEKNENWKKAGIVIISRRAVGRTCGEGRASKHELLSTPTRIQNSDRNVGLPGKPR